MPYTTNKFGYKYESDDIHCNSQQFRAHFPKLCGSQDGAVRLQNENMYDYGGDAIDSSYESRIINLINQERQKQGLSPLQPDSQLTEVARAKAQDMSRYQPPAHYSPTLGGDEFAQLNNANIPYENAVANIFWGNGKQYTPEEAVTWWMNSPGHRANILNPNMTHIGVGYDYSPNAPTQNNFSMIAIRKSALGPISAPTPVNTAPWRICLECPIVTTPFHAYFTDPFNTEDDVSIITPCGPNHPGAKDLWFPSIAIGTPVYASEAGTINFLASGNPPCGNPPTGPCPRDGNLVSITSDIDQYITQYVHVTPLPNLKIGDHVNLGQQIGTVDISGISGGPHVHMARYTATGFDRSPTCDWGIYGVDL